MIPRLQQLLEHLQALASLEGVVEGETQDLAQQLGTSVRSLRRHLGELEAAGALRRESVRGAGVRLALGATANGQSAANGQRPEQRPTANGQRKPAGVLAVVKANLDAARAGATLHPSPELVALVERLESALAGAQAALRHEPAAKALLAPTVGPQRARARDERLAQLREQGITVTLADVRRVERDTRSAGVCELWNRQADERAARERGA